MTLTVASLVPLTFQLSNVRELEVVKYNYASNDDKSEIGWVVFSVCVYIELSISFDSSNSGNI